MFPIAKEYPHVDLSSLCYGIDYGVSPSDRVEQNSHSKSVIFHFVFFIFMLDESLGDGWFPVASL